MKFKLKYIPLAIFIVINIICIMAMNICAYSSYLPPQTYPNWSYLGLLFPVFLVPNILFILFWLVFKRVFVFIPLAGILLCAWAVRAYYPINITDDVPDNAIKFMSYNVMTFGDDQNVAWNDRDIIKYIKRSGADIVCLQEVGGLKGAIDNGSLVMEEYPYQTAISKKGIACLSKYPILSDTNITYPSEGNSSYAFEILIGTDTVLVVNNHFESYRLSSTDKESYKDLIKKPEEVNVGKSYDSLTDKLVAANAIRGPQVDSVAAFIEKSHHKYVIACGDFNESPISYSHHRLTQILDDAYTRSGNGPGLSYNRHGMYFRLDHILISENIETYKTVVDSSVDYSDHYPIYCMFNLKR